MKRYLFMLMGTILIMAGHSLFAQSKEGKAIHKADSTVQHLYHLPTRYFKQVDKKAGQLQSRLMRQSEKALRKVSRQEEKMRRKLAKIDSLAAHNIFTRGTAKLQSWQKNLEGKANGLQDKAHRFLPGTGNYLPYLDTLKNALGFLKSKEGGYLAGADKLKQGFSGKLNGSLDKVQGAQDKLQQAADLQKYLQEHRRQLAGQLKQYDFLQKDLLKMHKEVYYYAARLKNYKELFSDPGKAEAEAMALLRKVPAFQKFMQQHSQLAGLFSIPADYGQQSLEGLQTRAMVEREIQQKLAAAGPNGQQAIQQQMQTAKQQLKELKDKLPGGGSTAEMPDFQPKELKSKTFLQRLELGGNVQFQKSTTYFPTTSDIAGQIAYKATERGSIGIGAAYKLGLGSDIRHIALSNQGIGLRSFLDYQVKWGLYINGGFEQNYQTGFDNMEALKNLDKWTGSALIGISKKYKVSSKLKGNIILLYDFLHNQHIPRTEPLKFRIGYIF